MMKLFVSVGTDHHPFNRLVEWAERWARDNPDDSVSIQFGRSREPSIASSTQMLRRSDMAAELHSADVVVISCGPGGVMDARRAGRLPIVVPRRADRGEHVDDHQVAFAHHLAEQGLAECAETEDRFRSVLEDARADPGRFIIERDTPGEPEGVAETGRLVDELVWSS